MKNLLNKNTFIVVKEFLIQKIIYDSKIKIDKEYEKWTKEDVQKANYCMRKLKIISIKKQKSKNNILPKTPSGVFFSSIPGLGRSHGGGHGNPLQYSCLESPHGQRSLGGFSPWAGRVGHDAA